MKKNRKSMKLYLIKQKLCRRKKVKRINRGILVLVIVVVAFFIGIQILEDKNTKEIYLEYGDSFSDILLNDSQGNKFTIPEEGKPYKIVYFFDERCGTCVENLPFIERINQLVSSEMDVYLLWNSNVKSSIVQKYQLNALYNIQLDRSNKVLDGFPTIYILDEENTVIYKDYNNDEEKFVQKLLNLECINTKTQQLANRYFLSNYKSVKPILVYFTMEGCPDCEAVKDIVEDSQINEKFEIVTLYDSATTNQQFIDSYNLFYHIYEIDWFPTFLIIESETEYKLIRKEASNEIIRELLESY